eukprot:gene840-1635_t
MKSLTSKKTNRKISLRKLRAVVVEKKDDHRTTIKETMQHLPLQDFDCQEKSEMLSNCSNNKNVRKRAKIIPPSLFERFEKRLRVDSRMNDFFTSIFALSEMAYDASRSGTEEYVNLILNKTSNILKNHNIQSNNSVLSIKEQIHYLSKAIFLISIAGINAPTLLYDTMGQIIEEKIKLTVSKSDYFTMPEFSFILSSLAISGYFIELPIMMKDSLRFIQFHNNNNNNDNINDNNTNNDNNSNNFLTKFFKKTKLSKFKFWREISKHFHILNIPYIESNIDSKRFFWLQSSCSQPLYDLWLHSTKQKKVRTADAQDAPGIIKLQNNTVISTSSSTSIMFEDDTLPLVVDIGCGFGVSILGIASTYHSSTSTSIFHSDSSGQYHRLSYNFLGCDLSAHAINYAKRIASRWDIDNRCQFVVASAMDCMSWLKLQYRGPIAGVLIQFPTPYALDLPTENNSSNNNSNINPANNNDTESTKSDHQQHTGKKDFKSGNVQLPGTDDNDNISSSFMVSSVLIKAALECISLDGVIFIQSNVEDVAITIRNRIEHYLTTTSTSDTNSSQYNNNNNELFQYKLLPGPYAMNDISTNSFTINSLSSSNESNNNNNANNMTVTKRMLLWRTHGGQAAFGHGWLERNPLPLSCRSETEASYMVDGKPVYRIAWRRLS